jgi:folate-binding protein YgfZ
LGPQAGGLLVRALGASVPETDYALVEATVDGQPAAVARTPGFGMPAYSVFASPVLVHLMADRLGEFGAARADPVDLDAARIAAGFPRWGVDMDETTLAQEANMDTLGAISYTKGCYTGQETVARVHFRGHVNRLLRGLLFQGGGALVPRGSTVELDGKVVGDVRSMAHSPSLGRIALAMLRREVEPGSGVSVQAGGDLSHATVVELPFPR